MRASLTLTSALLLTGAAVGCNPGSFNSLLDHAPVLSVSPSSASSTSQLNVLPLPAPSEPSAARMLITVKDRSYVGVADFDMNGKVSLAQASEDDLKPIGTVAVHSAAISIDGSTILLGTPQAGGSATPGGGLATLKLTPTGAGGFSFSIQQPIGVGPATATSPVRLGIGVAAGKITNSTVGNFVALADNQVQVYEADGKTFAAKTDLACPNVQFASSDLYPYRPLAVGDVLIKNDKLPGLQEIVVGIPGKVVFAQWDGTSTLPCPSQYLATGAPAFGTSVAVGDFNADGQADLAVGNPPDTVYVYYGPLDDTVAALPSVKIVSATGVNFGARVAAFALRGPASAQLLVADPGANQGAGTVMLFNVPTASATGPIATLFDSSSADPGVFGLALGALEWNPQPCGAGLNLQLVPWATNGPNLLTFFNYVGVPQDPRCFAMPRQ